MESGEAEEEEVQAILQVTKQNEYKIKTRVMEQESPAVTSADGLLTATKNSKRD